MTEFNGPDPDYDRATAKDVIYPGGVRLSDPEHKSLQLQNAHAQPGEPADLSLLEVPEFGEEEEPAPKKASSKKK